MCQQINGNITRYSTITGDDYNQHLVFDEEKYNNHIKEENRKEQIESATEELEVLAKCHISNSVFLSYRRLKKTA